MKRRKFLQNVGGVAGMMIASPGVLKEIRLNKALPVGLSNDFPGVWRFTVGTCEAITPQTTRQFQPAVEMLKLLPSTSECPVSVDCSISARGCLVKLPLKSDELLYGLGLQFQSFQQRGLKKMLRVNADPTVDSGDSHAPVPFFVTTKGYGVLIDTARYATFYMGKKKSRPGKQSGNLPGAGGDENEILIEIPRATGMDVYVFGGPTMAQAVQRYNLFSGGGALPPRWGLGFWYRVQSDFKQEELLDFAKELRESRIPCDVLGLEPHWETHSYSSSYVWSKLFGDPAGMLASLKKDNYRVNMWFQAFVDSSSPIYNELIDKSGDYEVWNGLVPDFTLKEARKVFSDYQKKTHVDIGISGYKADECDNSDFTGNWSFPELSKFPSGADGEQMHSIFGLRYQDAIMDIFKEKKQRTYGLVRSSGALAAPYPFVLYSDLYAHQTFIHAIAQSGFTGLLWTPEVRHATSDTDLIRRLQTVVLSPLAMVNAWYLKNPPWKQIERNANNAGRFAADWQSLEAKCREVIELRMRFIPYIHSAFVRYKNEGFPPFRALILDYPEDIQVSKISDQYMMGDSVMVAPVTADSSKRDIYLPIGDWYDFWTKEKLSGGRKISVDVPLDQIPVFVKAGSILPLAQATLHSGDPDSWKITATVYGENTREAVLYEDDGSWNPELTSVSLSWDSRKKKGSIVRSGKTGTNIYSVLNWEALL